VTDLNPIYTQLLAERPIDDPPSVDPSPAESESPTEQDERV